jgi:hypothetical protein
MLYLTEVICFIIKLFITKKGWYIFVNGEDRVGQGICFNGLRLPIGNCVKPSVREDRDRAHDGCSGSLYIDNFCT